MAALHRSKHIHARAHPGQLAPSRYGVRPLIIAKREGQTALANLDPGRLMSPPASVPCLLGTVIGKRRSWTFERKSVPSEKSAC